MHDSLTPREAVGDLLNLRAIDGKMIDTHLDGYRQSRLATDQAYAMSNSNCNFAYASAFVSPWQTSNTPSAYASACRSSNEDSKSLMYVKKSTLCQYIAIIKESIALKKHFIVKK